LVIVGLPQTIPHLWLHTRRAARCVTLGLLAGRALQRKLDRRARGQPSKSLNFFKF
jgi:hypothetical protein